MRYVVPQVPSVRLSAVRESVSWPEGADIPDVEAEWVSVHNPWGSIGWESRDYCDSSGLTVQEAAEMVRDFPGAVWGTRQECVSSVDYRTGVESTVTLFVDGPGAVAALVLAGLV